MPGLSEVDKSKGCYHCPVGDAAYHVCVKLVPLNALAKESLLLHGLYRRALVHADKAEVVQFALVDAASPCQLMVGGYQQHQLVLGICHCLLTQLTAVRLPAYSCQALVAQDHKAELQMLQSTNKCNNEAMQSRYCDGSAACRCCCRQRMAER